MNRLFDLATGIVIGLQIAGSLAPLEGLGLCLAIGAAHGLLHAIRKDA